ncbi:MAG: T9SS type A sorting domain-containing protein, partial [bacterium]|nr:T9SS type A sorting domain-containing protein [bacterium]
GSKVKGEGLKVNGERSTKNDSENLDQSFSTQHPTPYTLHQSFSTLHRASAQSVEAHGELPWKNNYFLGNDSSKWAPNCRNFSTVVYRDVWDGIDIEWYENDGKLEFDFIVHPGFDPNQIQMSIEGLEGDRISGFGSPETGLSLRERPAPKQSHLGNREQAIGNGNNVRDMVPESRTTVGKSFTNSTDKSVCLTDYGRTPSPESRTPVPCSPFPVPELRLQTSLGELRTALPSVYQVSANGTRNEIDATFQLTDQNTFGIALPNGYNPDHSLRIDPLIYSTFFGGTGDDAVEAMVGDGSGGVFLTGWARSTDFPTTPGVGQRTNWGGSDCFVTHLDSIGSQLIYSTYIGGSSDDNGYAIVTDNSGGVILTGVTMSSNYPTSTSAFQRFFGGYFDCFVTRLNSIGSALIFSTYLGGQNYDGGNDIVHDGYGGAVVVGSTDSTDYPTTANAFDRSYNGNFDCFVTHLNSTGSDLIYSTYLGGFDRDGGSGGFVDDSTGNIIVTGSTASTNFPTTEESYDTTFNGGSYDCFITCMNPVSSLLIFSTYLGGTGSDGGGSLIAEGRGGVVVIGSTNSSNFPVTPFAFDRTFNGDYDCFVSRISNTGTQLLYSTYFGGNSRDAGFDIAFDQSNSVVITGQTSSSNFPTTVGAFDISYNGGAYGDCFVSVIDSTSSYLIYSTFLGGAGFDRGNSIVKCGLNDVLVTGYTSSSDFPITPNAFDPTFNGTVYDCFITRLSLVADTSDITPDREVLPLSYAISQNYPNPFNSSTSISYLLPKPGHVNLRLFDITGREVATLVNQKQQTGSYRVTFDGKYLSSGTYFVRMQAGEFVKTQKMLLLR